MIFGAPPEHPYGAPSPSPRPAAMAAGGELATAASTVPVLCLLPSDGEQHAHPSDQRRRFKSGQSTTILQPRSVHRPWLPTVSTDSVFFGQIQLLPFKPRVDPNSIRPPSSIFPKSQEKPICLRRPEQLHMIGPPPSSPTSSSISHHSSDSAGSIQPSPMRAVRSSSMSHHHLHPSLVHPDPSRATGDSVHAPSRQPPKSNGQVPSSSTPKQSSISPSLPTSHVHLLPSTATASSPCAN